MKKPTYDEPELQLQEYEWEADATADRRIDCMTASMAVAEFVDIGEDTPEYRH